MALDTYITRERPAPAGAPLFFAFHGTGGDETQFFDLAHQLVPEAGVIAPRGDVMEHGAARYFRRTAEGVYDMQDLAVRTQEMAAFVGDHTRRVQPCEVIGLGYSNGANILASMLFQAPGLFDRVVLMHPLIPWRPADLPTADGSGILPRVLMTAGENDPICAAPATRALAEYFERNGAELTLQWHAGGHEIRPEELSAARTFLQAALTG